MIYKPGTFTVVPTDILKRLNSHQQIIFVWLCHHANKDMTCFPSYQVLANESKYSRRKVVKIIEELINNSSKYSSKLPIIKNKEELKILKEKL